MASHFEAADTRKRLILATIEAIDSGGEGSVRVQSIAEAVGVREPSVYHFFKNRAALVEAAQIERYQRSFLQLLIPFETAVALADTKSEFERAVAKVLSWSYVPDRHEARSARVNVLGAAQSSPTIAAAVVEANYSVAMTLAAILKGAQDKGWMRSDLDPLALAYWVNGQINGRVIAEMDSERVDLDAWNKVSVEAIIGLFRSSGPT